MSAVRRVAALCVAAALLLLAPAARALEVPYLSGRVNDQAGLLRAETHARITQQLAEHERATSDQVAVLTLESLEGENLEDFANRVFRDWGLGQRGRDNGVLLLVAPAERKLRIEVGYGLEGTLTDLVASRIIQRVIVPRFRAGDLDGGIERGVDAIVATLEGRAVDGLDGAAPAAGFDAADDIDAQVAELSLVERVLFGAFIFGIIGLFTVIGVTTPRMGWFLYFFLIPFWATFPIVVLGTDTTFHVFLTYLVGFPVVKLLLGRTAWYQKAARELRTRGSTSVGGVTISSGGSGWSSGGSGGFSGGGGSSGGGGASGSW